ncbi:MAG: DUF2184 domain-containing protein [Hyphomicrobium sp.]|nr:DUF2184 domain-containing protein [Hyphomicrobium sp.]
MSLSSIFALRTDLDISGVEASLNAALNSVGSQARWDSEESYMEIPDALVSWRQEVDEGTLAAVKKRGGLSSAVMASWAAECAREDSLTTSSAGAYPRDFEWIRSRVLDEPRAPLSGLSLFPIDTSIPVGAKKHTIRRALGSGGAEVYRGGNTFPRVRTTYVEESAGVLHVVTSIDTNFIEALTTDWAGLRQFEQDMRLAGRAIDEKLNSLVFYGHPASLVYGALTHPHIAKQVFPLEFSDATPPEDLAYALIDFLNTPYLESKTTYSPDVVVLSPRQFTYIFSRMLSSSGFDASMSIGKYVQMQLSDQGRRVRFVPAQEMSGAWSGGDVIFCYRNAPDAIAFQLIQGPTALPVFRTNPMEEQTVIMASTGGITSWETGNCLIGYATNGAGV